MDDADIDNEFLNDNFQEEIKNTQSLKSDSYNNEENLYELNDDTFQISTNTKDNRANDNSKFLGRQTKSQNKINNNNETSIFMETPQNKNIYNNYNNVNEDISGISLLKELEDQWNNVEKQKMSYYSRNKGDESKSTNSNTKNNSKAEKYKYLKEFVELKKNKFLSMRQKAKNIRENDQEIEQFFLIKFKEMEKYKIIDNNLKKQIEIRQQEKMNEDMNQNTEDNNNENNYENYDSQKNIKGNYQLNYNYDDYNNINEYNNKYYENEKNQQRANNIINKKSFGHNGEWMYNNKRNEPGNKNIFYENIGNGNPELDDLIYETPARNSNYIFNNNNQMNDKNMNINMNMNINNIEENKNNNIQNIYKSQKNLISGKLIEKMKNLFEEINGQNSQRSKNESKMPNNNNKKQIKSYESGVFGINSINIINHDYTDNDILMNIRNNTNKKEANLIGDSNKSINLNLNFDYSNNIMNNSTTYNKYINKDSSFIKNNNIEKSLNDNSINKNIFIQENNDELSSLQKNFDDIMSKIKSGYNNGNSTKNSNKYNFKDNNDNNGVNDDNEDKEFDKYFEELSKEAKIKVKQNKGEVVENQINKYEFGENKLKNKIKESSEYLNKFVSEMNQNKNRFKQRMMAINNNLSNIKIKGGSQQRSLSGYKLSRVNLKNNFNENI